MRKHLLRTIILSILCPALALVTTGCSNSALLNEVQDELDALTAAYDTLQDELDTAEAEKDTLQDELDTAEAANSTLQAEFDATAAEYDALMAQLEDSLWLEDTGVMFMGGDETSSQNYIHQALIHYLIPKEVKYDYPVIMYPGGNVTSLCYMFTPDGREGWAQLFARAGFKVYVFDPPGYSSFSFDEDALDLKMAGTTPTPYNPLLTKGGGGSWTGFGIGPTYGVGFEDTQFPVDDADNWLRSLVTTYMYTDFGYNDELRRTALAELIEEVGPAILLAHSAAGAHAVETTRDYLDDSDMVKALIAIEAPLPGLTEAQIIDDFANKPLLSVYGDHMEVRTHMEASKTGVENWIDILNANGGYGEMIELPSEGIAGNTHLMMYDENNDVIADLMIDWLDEHLFVS